MKTLESKLEKAHAKLNALLSVCWWTLSKDEEEIYSDNLKSAMDAVEELQRRISCTKEVRAQAKAMREGN